MRRQDANPKPRWRKTCEIEHVMTLPNNWRLRVIWCNNSFWMWQLHAGRDSGGVIHGTAPTRIDEPSYPDADAAKKAAVLYAQAYFKEMLESVS